MLEFTILLLSHFLFSPSHLPVLEACPEFSCLAGELHTFLNDTDSLLGRKKCVANRNPSKSHFPSCFSFHYLLLSGGSVGVKAQQPSGGHGERLSAVAELQC